MREPRIKQVGWRIPVSLYLAIVAYADRTQRSVVGAAVYLLTQGLDREATKDARLTGASFQDAKGI